MGINWQLVKDEDLPKSIKNLIDLIGQEATQKLVDVYRGEKIYIPKKIHKHSIGQLIESQAAEKLAYVYGGLWLQIPLCYSANCKTRNQELKQARIAGKSIVTLAKEYKLSTTRIRDLIKNA